MKNKSFFNDSEIKNLVADGRNLVTGTIKDQPIKIERYLCGWSAYVRITVSGIIVHDTNANQAEKDLFVTLHERAHDEQQACHIIAKQRALHATSELFANY